MAVLPARPVAPGGARARVRIRELCSCLRLSSSRFLAARAMMRATTSALLCLWCCVSVVGASPLGWLFGRRGGEFGGGGGSLAATCRRLEREAQEFESGERVLLEQLRQMRMTTGALRTSLRDSMKKSDAALANATEYIERLEADVASLKARLADAEARVGLLEASKAADADALAAERARAETAANEAAKLKAALAKVTGELNALKHAQQGDAVNSRKPMAQKAPQKAANKPKAQAPSRPPAARQR